MIENRGAKEIFESSIKAEEAKGRRRYFLYSTLPLLAGIVWLALSFFAIRSSSEKLATVNADLANSQSRLDSANNQIVVNSDRYAKLKDSIERSGTIYKGLQDSLGVRDKQLQLANQDFNRIKTENETRLKEIMARNQTLIQQNDELVRRSGKLFDTVKILEMRKAKLLDDSSTLVTQIASLIDVVNKSRPRDRAYVPYATKKPAADSRRGTPLNRYAVGINGSPDNLSKIKSVVYYFNDPSFKLPSITRTDAQNKFEVTYDGWGCLNVMNITIDFKDGRDSQELVFNMCDALK